MRDKWTQRQGNRAKEGSLQPGDMGPRDRTRGTCTGEHGQGDRGPRERETQRQEDRGTGGPRDRETETGHGEHG